MIGRARELLAEFVDVVQAARALPHAIATCRDLELRVEVLEGICDSLAQHVSDIATAAGDIGAMVSEIYTGPSPADAEVPDA